MLPIEILIEDYNIQNLNSDNLKDVYQLIVSDKTNLNVIGHENNYDFDFEKLHERYVETLINTFEYFCGIFYSKELIGIIKGRLENKNNLENWFLTYILKDTFRNKGIGSILLNSFEEHISINFGVERFFAVISSENKQSKNFWIKNGYKFERESYYLKINNKPAQIYYKYKKE
ncbi:hypothetical protein ABG79_00299 [Caloramator mitchellensis]|uniref:N-acetyltransferase domain-containing protein n=1 Tax=Caloramator mitchellensis TaxID=908809 RepID=A0A0R3JX87_CALMK|nr:GNAT family N-acetyltransferase [Caloramator mitchellensis]KRQ88129.1 hypothetical protein ABG79_00299 [Caloramator mitchellensis]